MSVCLQRKSAVILKNLLGNSLTLVMRYDLKQTFPFCSLYLLSGRDTFIIQYDVFHSEGGGINHELKFSAPHLNKAKSEKSLWIKASSVSILMIFPLHTNNPECVSSQLISSFYFCAGRSVCWSVVVINQVTCKVRFIFTLILRTQGHR